MTTSVCGSPLTEPWLSISFTISMPSITWPNAQFFPSNLSTSLHTSLYASTSCCKTVKTRRQTRWNLQGCPKLTKRSQPLVGRSSPYCGDMWRTYCCLTSFFPIVDKSLICEDIARRSCAMVPRWRFLATFLRPVFAANRVQHISDLHSKFALGPRHV